MSGKSIETRLVYGFLDAGKTTFIKECVQNDYFYKYGTTLILCFEEGEETYDPDILSERRTTVAFYDRNEDVHTFCMKHIEDSDPDRIYVEMNTMIEGLKEKFPDIMGISYTCTWIDWETFPSYYANFTQMIRDMVSDSHQVTFRGCPSKEFLSPYANGFRLMNRKASYLRQDPMGYHEKAFDLFLPFSLEDDEIMISEDRFLIFWLDAFDHPEHYDGKKIRFTDPLEIRESDADRAYSAGRVVMTCCMADLQFMSFELEGSDIISSGGWFTFDAQAVIENNSFGQRRIKLKAERIQPGQPPGGLILKSSPL